MPWPEEENRVTIDRLSDLLFAPTSANAANLRRDHVHGEVHVTGNSGIDALAALVGPLPVKQERRWWPKCFHLLVTCHRRENWGAGLEGVAEALITLGDRRIRSNVLLPPNPMITARLTGLLGNQQEIRLVPPLSHAATIEAMRSADLVLTDSGGMQEEAPALGVPLLILRDKTERPEALASGSAELVGTDPRRIVSAVERLRQNRAALKAMRKPALPFGDGHSAPRIAAHCLAFLEDQAIARQSWRA
jgi:UDP-N-acetylglucosamine 2-epimerase (non-hydrolysing)